MTVEDTTGEEEGDDTWGEVVVAGVAMPAGTHSLKLCGRGGVGIRVDSMSFELVSGPGAGAGGGGAGFVRGRSRSGNGTRGRDVFVAYGVA